MSDDELAAIRKRKMELLMKRATKPEEPEIPEPLSKGYVNVLSDANFWPTLQSTKTALIDFFGEWCGPCKALAPIFAELAKDYAGKVFFGKIDIDRNPRTTAQFGVQSVPMVVAFKDGKAISNLPGLRRYNDYDTLIGRLLSK